MRCGKAWQVLAALTCASLSACDPTSGFQDTADAALPSVKRYFDGPGQQLSEGPWSRVVVDLDADTLYHLGARRLDDEEPTFHLFGNDQREGCSVSPNAGTWLMGKPEAAPFRLLPFLENMDGGRGRLRFTTMDCDVQEIAIEDAGRPYPRLYDNGYLVPTKRGYTFVDPWAGESREITPRLQAALVWNNQSVLFWADEKLKSFTDQFEARYEVGESVVNVLTIRQPNPKADATVSYLMEEAGAGLSRVDYDPETQELSKTPVLEGACNLQVSDVAEDAEGGVWLSLQMPCDSAMPTLLRLDEQTFEVLDQVEVPLELDASLTRVLVGTPTPDGEPSLTVVYLTDYVDGLGSLWAYPIGAEEPIFLGEHGKIATVTLDPSDSDWDGSAQVNYQKVGGFWTYDWLRFRWNGESEVRAEHVMHNRSDGELLVNFDGVSADVPAFDDDGVVIQAEKVPPSTGRATSFTKPERHARIDQFDGATGRVRLSRGPEDELSLWDPVADGVTPESLRFVWFMPAVMFLENWDAETETGDLVAYNYELDARATISEGVSSFDLTSYPWDGVVYAVPYGKRQGVWFSKAK